MTVDAPPLRGASTLTCTFRRAADGTARPLEIEVAALNGRSVLISEPMGWNNGAAVPVRTVD
ncbi:hypothetical protein JIG36_12590 [Actinoplanes sp. LDG1-06]|uniref:Uncharacterized protein n=1 Tax=Paractinoplanes ovalisporus TaxID=2810368 RepID=A0ABS2A981_9ACTN|nr:hypothetical protein [Actinoplanes ovalisporus]MBM2616395.1 hypothetical protein [Actinoplanes ovalisporus]